MSKLSMHYQTGREKGRDFGVSNNRGGKYGNRGNKLRCPRLSHESAALSSSWNLLPWKPGANARLWVCKGHSPPSSRASLWRSDLILVKEGATIDFPDLQLPISLLRALPWPIWLRALSEGILKANDILRLPWATRLSSIEKNHLDHQDQMALRNLLHLQKQARTVHPLARWPLERYAFPHCFVSPTVKRRVAAFFGGPPHD